MPVGTLIIRADASIAMGTGHVMRCLALAQAWQDAGGDVVFAMAESTPAIEARLRSEAMGVTYLGVRSGGAQDAQATAQVAHSHHALWIAVDGYKFGCEYQRGLRNAGLKILLIDDHGQCGYYLTDIIVDQNTCASDKMYANREARTNLLLGSRYAMLRREFQPWHEWKRDIPPVARQILITIGGTDPEGLTFRLIEAMALISIPDLQVTAVVGGSNPCLDELQQMVAAIGSRVHLVSDPTNMPELMAKADLAIICGGGTLWELLFMGCPTLSYFRNDTQQAILPLSDCGAVCNLGLVDNFQPDKFTVALKELVGAQASRKAMSESGRQLVDGKGTARVFDSMVVEVNGTDAVTLITVPVDTSERDEFLQMAEHHFSELNPRFEPAADWRQSYFESVKSRESVRWIVAHGQRAGFIVFGLEEHRFLPRKTGVIYELYVAPEQRRKGIARACARQVIEELQQSAPSKIQLEVVEGNTAAVLLWKSLGFQKVTERLVLTK